MANGRLKKNRNRGRNASFGKPNQQQPPGKLGGLPIVGAGGQGGFPKPSFGGAGPSMGDAGAGPGGGGPILPPHIKPPTLGGGDTFEPWNIPPGQKGYGMTGPPKLVHPILPPHIKVPPTDSIEPWNIPPGQSGIIRTIEPWNINPNSPEPPGYGPGSRPIPQGGGPGPLGRGNAVRGGRMKPKGKRQAYTGNPNWSFNQALKHAGMGNIETGDANYNTPIFNHGGEQTRLRKLLRKGVINRDQAQEYRGQLRDWRDTFGKPGTFGAYWKNQQMFDAPFHPENPGLIDRGLAKSVFNQYGKGALAGANSEAALRMLGMDGAREYFQNDPAAYVEMLKWAKAGGSGDYTNPTSGWGDTSWGSPLMAQRQAYYSSPEYQAQQRQQMLARMHAANPQGAAPQPPAAPPMSRPMPTPGGGYGAGDQGASLLNMLMPRAQQFNDLYGLYGGF